MANKMRAAIVNDWLYGGGAEKVVLELHRIFPDAPIYTSYCTDEWRKKLDGKVITGYLQSWPFSKLRKFLPLLRQRWFSKLDLSDFDLVISSSGNGEAKFVLSHAVKWKMKTNLVNGKSDNNRPVHISYCHTPTHFYWRHYDEYLRNPGFQPKWLIRFALKLLVGPLRKRDYAAAQKVDYFIANSNHIKNDIKQFYGRDSEVIHPPVDVDRFASILPKSRQGFVTMGRQTPYKKTDLIIAACNELELPLTVIGRGPEHNKLVTMAGPTITFKTDVSDEQMPLELASAEAFIFAAHEDFGLAPVEAMAAGTPVIAYKAGGALDYVVPGVSGEFFSNQNVESLVMRLREYKFSTYHSQVIKNRATLFDATHFRTEVKKHIEKALKVN